MKANSKVKTVLADGEYEAFFNDGRKPSRLHISVRSNKTDEVENEVVGWHATIHR